MSHASGPVDGAVRCGVIGLGLMGAFHAGVLAAMGRADLAVACDLRPGAADSCPPGVRFTTSVSDALDEPGLEAVLVCTPDHLHREVVEEALRRGLHVLCEKPLASTLRDAEAMAAAAADAGRRLVAGHVLRFDPRYVLVRKRAAEGELGDPVHLVARRNSSIVEGRHLASRTTLALYLAVHDLDVMQWIAGARIDRVYAESASVPGLQGHASVVSTVHFENGAVGLSEVSWALPERSGLIFGDVSLAYVGRDACAYIDGRHPGLEIFGGPTRSGERPDGDAAGSWLEESRGVVEVPDYLYTADVDGVQTGPYVAELEHFLLGVRDGRPAAISVEEAVSALRVALAVQSSLDRGQPVAVE